MTEFTPISALVGGAMIGAAAVLLLALLGRIAGISGILATLLPPPAPAADWPWRVAFVAGLVAGPLMVMAVTGAAPAIWFPVGLPWIALAGFLVGIGTVIGSGCTSGHGVCGIARLAPRSLAATGVFMAAAIATVFFIRHGIGG
ncbi:MAG: YeeE/YedE family protein [Rhodospirillales bacterium]|nr:MAG: YeeE/YedE family protein [Rhodospirillales bacterium]